VVNRAVWGAILALVGYYGARYLVEVSENQALIVAGLFFVVAVVLAEAGKAPPRGRVSQTSPLATGWPSLRKTTPARRSTITRSADAGDEDGEHTRPVAETTATGPSRADPRWSDRTDQTDDESGSSSPAPAGGGTGSSSGGGKSIGGSRNDGPQSSDGDGGDGD